METIINVLFHTPTYVYFIFVYLVIVGIRTARDRVVSLYKSMVVVAVFLYLSINGIAKLQLDYGYYLALFMILAASAYLGWLQAAKRKILIDREKMLLSLPGSWATLVLVFVIFSSKYYIGYKSSLDPSFLLSSPAKLLAIVTSGFSSGAVVGRFINYIYRFKADKHTALSKKNETPS